MQFAGRQLVPERLVDTLLALHAVLAGEFGADHEGLEVLAVAIEFQVFAGHAGKDELFDLFGVHRVQALSFQPRFNRCNVSSDTATKQATTTARLLSGATSETPKKP